MTAEERTVWFTSAIIMIYIVTTELSASINLL